MAQAKLREARANERAERLVEGRERKAPNEGIPEDILDAEDQAEERRKRKAQDGDVPEDVRDPPEQAEVRGVPPLRQRCRHKGWNGLL